MAEKSIICYAKELKSGVSNRIYLSFNGFVICFSSNSENLLRELSEYYSSFLTSPKDYQANVVGYQGDAPAWDLLWQIKKPDIGKTKIKEEFFVFDQGQLVKKVQTGVHLLYINKDRYIFGPLLDNPNQVVNFINNIYLDYLLKERGLLFHAAGMCHQGKGLGMAGVSGMGKSTLMLKLIQHGYDFVSNDRLVVNLNEHLSMHGIPKYPRVNPGTILNQPKLSHIIAPQDRLRHEALSTDDLWELEEKYDVIVEQCFPACAFKLQAEMVGFIILNWDRRNKSPFSVNPINPGDHPELVVSVMKSPGILLPNAQQRLSQAGVVDYMALLSHCEVFELSGGVDFDGAAKFFSEYLAQ